MKERINVRVLKDSKEKEESLKKYFYVEGNGISFRNGNYECISLEKYFIRNNISPKYRKMIFQKNSILKSNEYITGVSFDTDITLPSGDTFGEVLEQGIGIIGNSNVLRMLDQRSPGIYASRTEGISLWNDKYQKINYKNVLSFFKEMKEDGELKPYINSITSFMFDGLRCSRERKILRQLENNTQDGFDHVKVDDKIYRKVLGDRLYWGIM